MIHKLTNHFFFALSIVLVLCAGMAILCVFGHWWWALVCMIVELFAIHWLYRICKQPVRKVAFLLDAIDNNDAAIHFYEENAVDDISQVNGMLNQIAKILYNTKQDVAQREKYYELILDFVDTGIVVLSPSGSVYQKNKAAMNLLGLSVFTHIRQLEKVSVQLMQMLESAHPNDKLQVQIDNERETVHLSLRVSGIKIKNEELRIVALSNINRELDEREMDAWIRLTRVLTHEIMNSLTPVTSISETLLTLPDVKSEEMKQGLETISTTSKGLINFVNSYRQLTRLPHPEPRLFDVKPFIERMIHLAMHQSLQDNVTIDLTQIDKDLMLFADEQLVGQVVTNLLNNAIQAIGNQHDGAIEIKAYCDEDESVIIEICNNGPKISSEVANQMFIPFFTTKEEGCGVGLSISKQIMRLSGGTLTLLPYTDKAPLTTFVLKFN